MSEDPRPSPLLGADALIVLGCRVHAGQPLGPLQRRLDVALDIAHRAPQIPCIMSGGTVWDEERECHVMQKYWVAHGQDSARLLLEEESQSTPQNADRSARLCEKFGYHRVILVTCDFHMKRASRLFSEQGLQVMEHAAPKNRTLSQRIRLSLREWGAAQLEPWERRLL